MKGYIKVAIHSDGVRYFYKTDTNAYYKEVQDVAEAEEELIYAGVKWEDIEKIAEFKNIYK
jgi:hemerythrin superfamily protein